MRQFIDKEIIPYCHEWDEAKQVPRQLYHKMAENNLLLAIAGSLDESYMQGQLIMNSVRSEEFDPFHVFIIIDEFARCGSGGVLWNLFGGLGIGLVFLTHLSLLNDSLDFLPLCCLAQKI